MSSRCFRLRAALALVLVVTGACGGDSGDSTASEARVVSVRMVDSTFEPASLKVQRGETVEFRFTNAGQVAHDAFIGDHAAQREHEQEMRSGDAHGGHGDDAAITVDPGDTGAIRYAFDRSGAFEVGCHQPGHYDAGMRLSIEVT